MCIMHMRINTSSINKGFRNIYDIIHILTIPYNFKSEFQSRRNIALHYFRKYNLACNFTKEIKPRFQLYFICSFISITIYFIH